MLRFFRLSKKDSRERLIEVLGSSDIPNFPAALMSILETVRDPNNSMNTVADKVQADPGLVVRVLRTVNSAAYGLGRSVSGIQHACSLMGRSRLESLVLSLAVRDSSPDVSAPGFDSGRFWKAAALRASLARLLASHLHPSTQAEAFTAGLLQDLAVPFLAKARTAEYCAVLQLWQSTSDSNLIELEHQKLNWTHTEIGAALARSWDLPDYLVDAISAHHSDEADAPVDLAVRLVSHLRENPEEAFENLTGCWSEKTDLPDGVLREALVAAQEQAAELSHLLN